MTKWIKNTLEERADGEVKAKNRPTHEAETYNQLVKLNGTNKAGGQERFNRCHQPNMLNRYTCLTCAVESEFRNPQ